MRALPLGFVLAIFLLCGAVESSAQNAKKLGVYVVWNGDDTVGQQLAFAVREELRRSAAYASTTEDAALITISLISLDLATRSEPEGHASAVAVVYTMKNLVPYETNNPQTWLPIYLTTNVLTVGRNRTEFQSKNIVATLDNTVENYRAQVKR